MPGQSWVAVGDEANWERGLENVSIRDAPHIWSFGGYPADQRTLTLFKPALKGLPLDCAIGQHPKSKDISHLC